jgi:hypothetical protein
MSEHIDPLNALAADTRWYHRQQRGAHIVPAIGSGISTDDLVLFGGTALSRTHLADATQ